MPALKFGLKEVCLEGLTLFPLSGCVSTAEKERHVARDADAQSVCCPPDVLSPDVL
jgi:hypothetical protein